MIINSIHIYGFGKLKELNISFKKGINVIEGLNEAGKSTIMAFIRSMLFGFESRRNLHLRYEPIDGGSFGGALNLIDYNGEVYRIERIFQSKITGDVKVYLPNGEIKGEEYLPYILGKINEQVFKQIYSFGLTELQQIDALEDDQINDFIYHASTGSVNQILKMKNYLETVQQFLFKTSGRKPEINQLLTELDDEQRTIEKLKDRNEQYLPISNKLKDLDTIITKYDLEIEQRKSELIWLEKVKGYQKHYQRIKEIEQELLIYPSIFNYPDNGIDRINSLIARIDELELESVQLHRKKDLLEVDLNSLDDNPIYVENEEYIVNLKEDLALYKELKAKNNTLKTEIKDIDEKINNNFNQLGSSFNEEKVTTIEYTLKDKQYLQELARKLQLKEKERDDLSNDLENNKRRLVQLNTLKDKYLSEELEQRNFDSIGEIYPKIKSNWQEYKEKQLLSEHLQEQKDFFEAQQESKGSLGTYIALIGNGLLFLTGIIFFLFGMINYGIIFLLFSGFTLILTIFKKDNRKSNRFVRNNLKKLEKQMDKLNSEIFKINNETIDLIKIFGFKELSGEVIAELTSSYNHFLENEHRINEIRNRVKELNKEIEFIEGETETLEQKANKSLNDLSHLNNEWDIWLKEHFLEKNISTIVIFDIMSIIQYTKELFRKKKLLKEELDTSEKAIFEYERKVEDLRKLLKNNYVYPSIEEFIYYTYDNFKKNQRLNIEKNHLKKDLNQTLELFEDVRGKINLAKEKYYELFNFAKATDIEDYYAKGNQYLSYQELIAEKKQLEVVIKSGCHSDEEYNKLLTDLNNLEFLHLLAEIEQLDIQIKENILHLKELIEEKGQLQNQIKQMEEDLSLSELNQQYASKQTELKNKVKDYLTIKIAKDTLEKTMKIYETEKQPKVIKLASDYLRIMTKGNYKKIIKPIESQKIEVIRDDDIRFSPQYLSRGTVEQLFLAMRFAILEEFSKQMNLKIIILDDIFVNFDEKRFSNTLKVLEQLAISHQIIVFTCHQHIANGIKLEAKNVNHVALNTISSAI